MDISPLAGPSADVTAGIPSTAPSGTLPVSAPTDQTTIPAASGLPTSPDFQVQLSDLGQFSNALASFQNAVGALAQPSTFGSTGIGQSPGQTTNPLDNFASAYNQLQSVFSGLGTGLQGDPAVQGLQNQISGTVASYSHVQGSYVGLSLQPDGTLTLNAVAFDSTMIDTGGAGFSSGTGSLADQLGNLLQGYNGPGASALSGGGGSIPTVGQSSSSISPQDLANLGATLEKLLASMEAFMQFMLNQLLGGGSGGQGASSGQGSGSGGLSPADILAVSSMNPNSSTQNSGG